MTTFILEPDWPTILQLATERWGEANHRLSKPDDIRFGSNGSKSVKPSTMVWHDHETDEKGGYVDMHHSTRGPLPPRSDHKPKTTRRSRKFRPPVTPFEDHGPHLYDWFSKRHIGARTVVTFGVYACEWEFKGAGRLSAIAFPYRHQDELHSMKYRTFTEPRRIAQDCAGENVLFNADVVERAETLYWVEGEIDVMTLHECGYHNVVSLRDGAAGFASLAMHEEALGKVKWHVLAGDMDAAGLKWREQLAHRFGRHKCFIVTWPDGCKDANETLCSGESGFASLTEAVQTAEPYPIKGAYPLKPDEFEEWFSATDPATMTTGCRATDDKLHLPSEGRLIVVTGFANHGKSSWLRHIAVHTAEHHDRRWLIFSPEHRREEILRLCAQVYIGKRFKSKGNYLEMDRPERDRARDFLAERIIPVVCDAKDEAPTLDWLLDVATSTVMRYGITDFLIDPWNEVEHSRKSDQTESDHIGRSLQRLRQFAEDHHANCWVSAHPTKALATGGEKRMIIGYDINGSANWANKADLGLTVEKVADGNAKIGIWKSRDASLWGRTNAIATIWFDQANGRYLDPVKPIDDTPPPAGSPYYNNDD